MDVTIETVNHQHFSVDCAKCEDTVCVLCSETCGQCQCGTDRGAQARTLTAAYDAAEAHKAKH